MGVVRPPGGSRETRCNTFRGMLHGAGLEWAPDLRPVRCRFFRLVGGHAPYRRSGGGGTRSEEHTSELQSLMRTSYAVFCLKKKTHNAQVKAANTIYHRTKQDTTHTKDN